jgi:hypothetical protein
MMYPKYVCITCGQPSSRRWNISRHIKICHFGFGRYVTFTEYLAGRQSGIYLPTVLPEHPPNKKEVTTSDLAPATELLNTYCKSFWAEKGRQLARLSQYKEPITTNNITYSGVVDYTCYYQSSNDDNTNGRSHRCPLGNLLNMYNQRMGDNISEEPSNGPPLPSTDSAAGNLTAEVNIDNAKNAMAMGSTDLKSLRNKSFKSYV